MSEDILPQSLAVCETKASGLGIEIVTGNPLEFDFDETFFGALLQYPGKSGQIVDYTDLISSLNSKGIKVTVAADLLALTLLKSPGEMGSDIVVGASRRVGVPMGYGRPHAAFMGCSEEYKRVIPGRIIGVSQDRYGKFALRMAV